MPEPSISSHPVSLHTLQPLPLHMTHLISTSADGSVNMDLPPDAQFDTATGTLDIPADAANDYVPENCEVNEKLIKRKYSEGR